MGYYLVMQYGFESDILPTMNGLETAIKEKDAEKLVEVILAGFQQLDKDLKAENK